MNIESNIVRQVQNQLKSPQREIDQLSDFDLDTVYLSLQKPKMEL